MRVLVTGAGGFIGSHLSEALRDEGHEVRAMARYHNFDTFGWLDEIDGVEKVRGDVRDGHQMLALVRGMDRVYHLAALGSVPYSFEAPHQFVETNTLGTLNVALACIEHGVELVHTSTSEVYGNVPPPQREWSPAKARSPYAASKIGADQLVQSLSASRRLNACILRPFNTYGARQSARAIVPRVIQACMDESRGVLELGNLTPKRDLLFVSDTVSAFMHAEPRATCPLWVAATGSSYAMRDVVERIVALMERGDMEVQWSAKQMRAGEAEIWELRGNHGTFTAERGWRPEVDLTEGLQRTIRWFVGRGQTLVDGVV